MTDTDPKPHGHKTEVAVMAAAAVVGLAYAARALRRSRDDAPIAADDRRAAFAAYLREHLAGSDAALHAVAQLRDGHRGAAEGALFARLYGELMGERRVLMQVLGRLGGSTLSLERLVGHAGGAVARAAAVQPSGDARLLRTLEALTIGIQGKRCLWRALQMFDDALGFGEPSFLALESQAVRQWDDVDAYRRSVALTAFAI
jgi:hypothetical protein